MIGIDVGHIDAIVHVGYPGSISSLLQQAGRAGRRALSPSTHTHTHTHTYERTVVYKESLSILIAYDSPLDQYFANHGAELFSKSVEHAIVYSTDLEYKYSHHHSNSNSNNSDINSDTTATNNTGTTTNNNNNSNNNKKNNTNTNSNNNNISKHRTHTFASAVSVSHNSLISQHILCAAYESPIIFTTTQTHTHIHTHAHTHIHTYTRSSSGSSDNDNDDSQYFGAHLDKYVLDMIRARLLNVRTTTHTRTHTDTDTDTHTPTQVRVCAGMNVERWEQIVMLEAQRATRTCPNRVHPASFVNIRSIDARRYKIYVKRRRRAPPHTSYTHTPYTYTHTHTHTPTHLRVLAEIEGNHAFLHIHPGAIYLHQGRSYLIKSLDIVNHIANAKLLTKPVHYYTTKQDHTAITVTHRTYSYYYYYSYSYCSYYYGVACVLNYYYYYFDQSFYSFY